MRGLCKEIGAAAEGTVRRDFDVEALRLWVFVCFAN